MKTLTHLLLVCFFLLSAGIASAQSQNVQMTSIGNLSAQPIDSCVTADCEFDMDVIQGLKLLPNYTTGSINTVFAISQSSYVTTRVYNIADGQQIYILFQGTLDPGSYDLNYELPPMPNGSYELVMETSRNQQTQRFVLQR